MKSRYFKYVVPSLVVLLLTIGGQSFAEIPVPEFKDKANAHRLRLVQRALHLAKDPQFIQKFPEYAGILREPKNLAAAVLGHDSMKNDLPDNHSILRTLARADGVDYRSLPEASTQRREIEAAIRGLNDLDEANEKKVIARHFKNPQQQKLVQTLINALDKHDTATCRSEEMGKCMKPASDWLAKSDPEAAKISKYIETQPDIVSARRYTPEFVRKHGFESLATNALSTAQRMASSPKLASRALQSLGRAGAIVTPIVVVAEVGKTAMNPDNPLAENVTVFLTGTSSTSDCQTVGCAQFFEQCHKHHEQVVDRESCVEWMLSHPLDKQEQWRQDGDLDRIVQNWVPGVDQLSCEEKSDHEVIHFELRVSRREVQSHRFRWPASGSSKNPVLAIINPQNGDLDEKILYHKGEPSLVQKCTSVSGSSCRSYPTDHVRVLGMLAPRSHRALKFMKRQQENLISCCESETCREAFKQRKERIKRNVAQQR